MPEVQQWRSDLYNASHKMTRNELSEPYLHLPVQQMDDLWTRDRWRKLIKTPEDQQRLRVIGVSDKYLDYGRMKNSPDPPGWQENLGSTNGGDRERS